MRCYSFTLIFILFCTSLYAQLDVVYLEGGDILRGNILAEVVGEGITIDTDEGELLIVKQSDISRIARVKAIAGYWDIIYLKANETRAGFITKYQWQESLTLTTMDGESIKITFAEIIKIERVTVPDDRTYNESVKLSGKSRKDMRTRAEGYALFFIEYGFQLGLTEDDRMAPGFFFNQVIAYRVQQQFSLGLGLSFDWLWLNGGQVNTGRKVFFDGRMFFPRERVMPYAFFNAGYDWLRRGAFINPGIGARFSFFDLVSINMAVGINLQQIDTDRPGNAGLSPLTRIMQLRIVID